MPLTRAYGNGVETKARTSGTCADRWLIFIRPRRVTSARTFRASSMFLCTISGLDLMPHAARRNLGTVAHVGDRSTFAEQRYPLSMRSSLDVPFGAGAFETSTFVASSLDNAEAPRLGGGSRLSRRENVDLLHPAACPWGRSSARHSRPSFERSEPHPPGMPQLLSRHRLRVGISACCGLHLRIGQRSECRPVHVGAIGRAGLRAGLSA